MRVLSPAALAVGASLLCGGAVALPQAQQAVTDAITVAFSDPARPGTIRAGMFSGGIVIRGGNRKDVVVTTRGGEDTSRRRSQPPPGLTRLNQAGRLTITEENNVIAISNGANRQIDIELQVPTRVNLNLSTHNNGDVLVENTDGDMEVTNHNGAIRLTNVAGSVVANTHNGDVRVSLTRITSDKAMSFASFNGDVDVTLPANAKANLKLRSDNGEIFTDFDVQMRPTVPAQSSRNSGGGVRIEINQSIYGSINGGGPEFELRSFNGNIYVRKGGQ